MCVVSTTTIHGTMVNPQSVVNDQTSKTEVARKARPDYLLHQ